MNPIESHFRQSFAAAGGSASRRAAGFEPSPAQQPPSFRFLQHSIQKRQSRNHSNATPGTPLISLRFANAPSARRHGTRYASMTPGGVATPQSAFRYGSVPGAQTPYTTPGRASYRSGMSQAAQRPASTRIHPPLQADWGALPEPRVVSVPSLLDGTSFEQHTLPAVLPVSVLSSQAQATAGQAASAGGGAAVERGGSSSGSLPSSARSSVATEPRQAPTERPSLHINLPPRSRAPGPGPGAGQANGPGQQWGLYSQAVVGAGGVHRSTDELLIEGAAAEAIACAAAAGLTRGRALYPPRGWVDALEAEPAPMWDQVRTQNTGASQEDPVQSHHPISEDHLRQFSTSLTGEARAFSSKHVQGGAAAGRQREQEHENSFSEAVLDAVFTGVVSSGTLDWSAVFAAVGLGRTDDADVLQENDVEYDSAIPVGTVSVTQGLSPSTLQTWLPRSGVLLTGGGGQLPGGGVALPAVDVLPLGGGVGGVRGALDDVQQQNFVVQTPLPGYDKRRSSRIPRLRGSPDGVKGGGSTRQHAAASSSAVARLPSWAPAQPLQALGVSPSKVVDQEHQWQNKFGNAYLDVLHSAHPAGGGAAPGRGNRTQANIRGSSTNSPGTQIVQAAVGSTVADFLSDPRIADMVQGAVRSRLHRAYEHKAAVQRLRGRFARAQRLQTTAQGADDAHSISLAVLRGDPDGVQGGSRSHSPPPPPPPVED